jgi:hypothetical protein
MDFCTIEKVATTQWRNVQCVLNEGKNVSKSPMPCQLKKDRLEARRGRMGEGSRGGRRAVSRAVMLRDPLERMLSGYLNKCAHVPTRKLEGHCEPNSVFNGTILTSGIRDDKRQLFAAYVDAFPLKWNIHFFPQSMYCDGLFRHVDEYDFVGCMGGDFYGELDRMTSTFEGLPTVEGGRGRRREGGRRRRGHRGQGPTAVVRRRPSSDERPGIRQGVLHGRVGATGAGVLRGGLRGAGVGDSGMGARRARRGCRCVRMNTLK